MEQLLFKEGDIVYHKANNLRMVVINAEQGQSTCKYVDKTAVFTLGKFLNIELYETPKNTKDTPVVNQLELKGYKV